MYIYYLTQECGFLLFVTQTKDHEAKRMHSRKRNKQTQTHIHKPKGEGEDYASFLKRKENKDSKHENNPKTNNGITCCRQNVRMAPTKLATHVAVQLPYYLWLSNSKDLFV